MPGQGLLKGFHRYLAALLCVGIAFGTRVALDPLFGGTTLAFSVFYPAVVIAAYFAGVGPAVCASLLSAGLAYWAFISPAFAFKIHPEALTSMGFFALTSAVDIYFINGMTRALQEYRAERLRAEQLAKGNADLFREFNERATNHLQLVAALLQLRARDGLDAAYSNALAEASRRTMLISRVHRSLNGEELALTDFPAFARQLLDGCIDASGRADVAVTISGEPIHLPVEQATSIAIILFECFRFAFQHQPRDAAGRIEVNLAADGTMYRMRLSSPTARAPSDARPFGDELTGQVIEAVTDQLHGRFSIPRTVEGLMFELRIPMEPVTSFEAAMVPDMPEPVSKTLH